MATIHEVLSRLVNALDSCESNRGRFSCVELHDCRCPKSRASKPEEWRGFWRCECGSDELEAVLAQARGIVCQ